LRGAAARVPALLQRGAGCHPLRRIRLRAAYIAAMPQICCRGGLRPPAVGTMRISGRFVNRPYAVPSILYVSLALRDCKSLALQRALKLRGRAAAVAIRSLVPCIVLANHVSFPLMPAAILIQFITPPPIRQKTTDIDGVLHFPQRRITIPLRPMRK